MTSRMCVQSRPLSVSESGTCVPHGSLTVITRSYYQDMVGDYYGVHWLETYRQDNAERRLERERNLLSDLYHYTRISNLIQTSRPSGGLERLYS